MSHDLKQCIEDKCHMHQFDVFVEKCWDHLTNEQREKWSEQMNALQAEMRGEND